MFLLKKNHILLLIVASVFSGISAQITPQQAVSEMQKGINLGNTLEPPTEGGWNNPKAREVYFDHYKNAGFDVVRIPVRWDKHTASISPYSIDLSWLDRVEEVVDWGLERDLYIVLNAHHDNWIKDNYASQVMRDRFDSIWSQIAVRFRDKSEKLIFEVLNEPHGLTKAQNDEMHARVLSIIRKTNPVRLVIFQGHEWGGSDQLLTAAIPDDDFLIGSFHSYDPYLFGLQGEGTWGTSWDINNLKNKFLAVKQWSETHGIPVFMGEFGAINTCEYNSRMKHYKAYVEFGKKYGFSTVAWDDGGDFRILNRSAGTWNDIKDILIYASEYSPHNPKLQLYQDTAIKISWTNILQDHDSIKIQVRSETGTWIPMVVLPPESQEFIDFDRSREKYFYYRIIAHYNNAEPVFSNPQRIFLPEYLPKEREYFLGHPHPVPGTIEAEDFDRGGEGLTWHETTETNLPGAYRPDEGVDIYDRNGNGYHIGNISPGEWVEYSVDIQEEGTYLLEFEIACVQGGGSFQVSFGDSISMPIVTLNSNSWLETKTVSTEMMLAAGEQIFRFTALENPAFNFDKLKISLPSGISPYAGLQNFRYHIDAAKNLRWECSENIEQLIIFSMEGNTIYKNTSPGASGSISVQGYDAGIYFIAWIKNGKYKAIKFFLP